jgi:hypothetical protein
LKLPSKNGNIFGFYVTYCFLLAVTLFLLSGFMWKEKQNRLYWKVK